MKRRRFVAAAVVVLVGLALAAPGAGGPPTTDRSLKLDLIAKLKQGPQILILGDSRGRLADPTELQRLTGHTAFNAAVTGGSAPEAWVFTRYTADRFPRQKRRYIWFVSWGLATDIVPTALQADPRARRYLREVAPYLGTETDNGPWHTDLHYHRDGSVADERPPSPAQVQRVKATAAQIAERIGRRPPSPATAVDRTRFRLFEQLLGYMNARGERPVIVINPIYPTVLAALQKAGDPLMAGTLAYLQSLQPRYDFVLVDCEDSHVWGGNDDDWSNPTHVDMANMRRMLAYIVAHSDGALR